MTLYTVTDDTAFVDYYWSPGTGIITDPTATAGTNVGITGGATYAMSGIPTPNGDFLSDYSNIQITLEIYVGGWQNPGDGIYADAFSNGFGIRAFPYNGAQTAYLRAGRFLWSTAPWCGGSIASDTGNQTTRATRWHIRAVRK